MTIDWNPRIHNEDGNLRRTYKDVALEVVAHNDCNASHCIFRQIISHNGGFFPSEPCGGELVNEGCLMQECAESSYNLTSRDLVYHKFLAILKLNAGEFLDGGEDMRSRGAEAIFNSGNLKGDFDSAFESYMRGEIDLDGVYEYTMNGKDLGAMVGVWREKRLSGQYIFGRIPRGESTEMFQMFG